MTIASPPTDPDAFFRRYLPSRTDLLDPRLGPISSVGSLTVRVLDVGEWSVRIRDGAIETAPGVEDDVLLQLTLSAEDFEPLVVAASARLAAGSPPGAPRPDAPSGRPRTWGPLKGLFADVETAKLVRRVPGTVLFSVRDGQLRRRLLVSPGRREADLDRPDCTIEGALDDFVGAQAGVKSPMDLFVQGRLRITGNIQIAMALASVLM